MSILTSETMALISYQREHEQLLSAIYMAMQGKISPKLATPQALETILRAAANYVTQLHSDVTVLPITMAQIMGLDIAAFMYSDSNLYLHLNVPLTKTSSTFTLWEATFFPVPFHTNKPGKPGYTLLQADTKYLGFNTNGTEYIEITTGDLAMTTTFAFTRFTIKSFTICPVGNTSCLIAVWQGNLAYRKYCRVSAYPLLQALDFAVHLEANNYALSLTTNKYYLDCPTKTHNIN
jgi:hypothetical protein